MIVNLNLHGKSVIVAGGGKEATKRVKALLDQECKITVISNRIDPEIENFVKTSKVYFKKQVIKDAKSVLGSSPYMVIAATDNEKINKNIINMAKKEKVIVYSADNPQKSDFSNPATVNLEDTVQIAIFTGGQSPIMSKEIRIRLEEVIKKTITPQDICKIRIQNVARELAKEIIPTQEKRREFLKRITTDNEIDQLIKDGKAGNAEKQAIKMLKNWK